MGQKLQLLLLTAGLSLLASACGKPERRFESTCQLVRRDVVEQNDKGETEVVDVELEWDPAPRRPISSSARR